MNASIALLTLLVAAPGARADVKLPPVIGDHMVLQRDRAVPLWGWADPGEAVTVKFAGQSHATKAGPDGRWTVTLDPLKTSNEPLSMTITAGNTLTLNDILVGEVWVCSGQSNMAMSVDRANDPDLESMAADYPRIRLISVPQVASQEPLTGFKGQWEACSPQTVRSFSAVGYFFGRQLHRALDVPIGLIDNAWGGSAAEAWVRRDILEADAKYKPLLEQWDSMVKNYDASKAKAGYEKKLAAWKESVQKARAAGKPAPRRPRAPRSPVGSNHRPANLYNGVLYPILGYGIRGVIWYQGESNAGRAYQYRDLFPLMIKTWRDDWKQGDFPFYWVQLADFQDEVDAPGESTWAELREAQTMTMDKLPNTGEAVIIDIGEGRDIHPRNKQDVGKRLARWALAKDYGMKIPCQSPRFDAMEIKDGKAILTFKHVGSTLYAFDTRDVRGFAVAGADRKWTAAQGRIVGKDRVEVWSDAVKEPVAVRYAWATNPVCNLYSREGLPATPFRTDDWPGVTAGKDR